MDAETVTAGYQETEAAPLPDDMLRLGFRTMPTSQYMADQSRSINGALERFGSKKTKLLIRAYARTARRPGPARLANRLVASRLGGLAGLLDFAYKR